MTKEQKQAVENLIKNGVKAHIACDLCGVRFDEYNAEKLKTMMPDELNEIFGGFDNKPKDL